MMSDVLIYDFLVIGINDLNKKSTMMGTYDKELNKIRE